MMVANSFSRTNAATIAVGGSKARPESEPHTPTLPLTPIIRVMEDENELSLHDPIVLLLSGLHPTFRQSRITLPVCPEIIASKPFSKS